MPVVTPNMKNGPGTGTAQASSISNHQRNKTGSRQSAFLAGILTSLLVLVATSDSVRSADDTPDVDSSVVVLKIVNHTEWMIPKVDSLRDTFITRLQKTRRINVLDLDEVSKQQPVDEMFNRRQGQRVDISKWPNQPAARYVVYLALQSLDAEIKREFNSKLNVALEKPTVNVRMDLRVIELNPPYRWVVRDDKRKKFNSASGIPVIQEFFDTRNEARDRRKVIADENPNLNFPEPVNIPVRASGKIVFATESSARRQQVNVKAANFFPQDERFLKNDLVQDTIAEAMDSGILLMMDKLWPLKIIKLVGTDQVYVDRGKSTGMKIGYVFKVLEAGPILTDPDTGQTRGSAPGKLIARIKIVKTGDENSIAKIEWGESSTNLVGAFCKRTLGLRPRK